MPTKMLILLGLLVAALGRPDERHSGRHGERRGERGDVPGWVLITVMSAGLVAALWAVAGPQLAGMLRDALDSVR